jgi:hypothetical protein
MGDGQQVLLILTNNQFFLIFIIHFCNTIVAKVAELADAPDLGSGAERRGGSTPPPRTKPSFAHGANDGITNFEILIRN